MALVGTRRIRTVFGDKPKEGGETTRIKIPQPKERPVVLRRKDVIRRELLRPDREGYVVHKRGMRRDLVGEDPREMRAISRERLRGTLPERIVYLWLVTKLHLKDGVDFDFQSSMSGGRLEMGGIVADFRFEIFKMILNVQGQTHNEFLRSKKDEEQRAILESMGYKVYELTDIEIYNEPLFEDKMRRIFNLSGNGGGGTGYYSQEHITDENPGIDPILMSDLLVDTQRLYAQVEEIFG